MSTHYKKIIAAKPYIIAEVGSNWFTLDDCLRSIDEAAEAGANCVKFQFFSNRTLYGPSPNGIELRHRQELPQPWLDDLAKRCESRQVDFMCTAFSKDGYDAVDPYVKAHKIASSDNTNVPLIEYVKGLGKPFMISTGGLDEDELKKLGEVLWRKTPVENLNFFTLYCNAAYPSYDHDLRKMTALTDEFHFGIEVGLSDHSLDDLGTPVMAAQMGAMVIEKHFISTQLLFSYVNEERRSLPDAEHSLAAADFKSMVDAIRTPFSWKPSPSETDFRVAVRPVAKATRKIIAGDKLERGGNYGFFRRRDMREPPGISAITWGTGSSPEGRTLSRTVTEGEMISEGLLV